MPAHESASALLAGVQQRDRRSLSRAVSEMVNGTEVGSELAQRLGPGPHEVFGIGVTGPPGAGKSSLISTLAPRLMSAGHRVAVLLVDPSSPLTGGAVLGDRIRFSQVARSEDLYVRSFGHRGQAGGVIARAREVTGALAAAGFDIVIIETVGSGQSDIAITSIADCTVCATPPGLGDSIQALKAGIQEVADLFVVTKGDRPGADQLFRQLRGIPRRPTDDRPRPVFRTSATDATGLEELVDDLLARQRNSTRAGAIP